MNKILKLKSSFWFELIVGYFSINLYSTVVSQQTGPGFDLWVDQGCLSLWRLLVFFFFCACVGFLRVPTVQNHVDQVATLTCP